MKASIKKSISAILCVVMLLSTVAFPTTVGAVETPTITVSSANVCVGTSFKIYVSIDGNPGINVFSLGIEYEEDALILDSVEANSALGGQFSYAKKAVWLGSRDTTYNGNILTLSFTSKDDAAEGIYDVTVSYNPGDISNYNEDDIIFDVVPGSVSIREFLAGDINGDNAVNAKDLTRLLRYLSGEEVSVVEQVLDVNGDGNVSAKDLTRLLRFLAGENVEIFPKASVCKHSLTAVEAKPVTCTEDGNIAYWHCEKCDKYFSDETAKTTISLSDTVIAHSGHTVVIDPPVPATYESTGLTEGSHCSVCGEVIVKQEVYGPLQKDEYTIEYNLYNGDSYLMSKVIDNPNPSLYYSQDGLVLESLNKEGSPSYVGGYKFLGWYDSAEGGNRVTEIPAGSTRNYELYAHWSLISYKIQFDCGKNPLINYDDITYYVNTGRTLPTPDLENYIFMGWSDANGNIVTIIPKGTTGDITLYANWTSRRNLAKSNPDYKDPIIIEDSTDGKILFTYELGTIENIPLQTLNTIVSANGIKVSTSETNKIVINEETANQVSETISKATTNSQSWTLSSDWNNSTSVSETYAEKKGWSQEDIQKTSYTQSGSLSINSQEGGTTTTTNSQGVTAKTASSNHTEVSNSSTKSVGSELSVSQTIGLSAKESISTETTVSNKLGLSLGVKDAGVTAGGSAEVGFSNTTKVGVELEQSSETTSGRKDSFSYEDTKTSTSGQTKSEEYTTDLSQTKANGKNWSTDVSYQQSNSSTSEHSLSTVLSSEIASTKGYGSTYSEGGENSESQTFGEENTKGQSYSNAVTLSKTEETIVENSYETDGSRSGAYRVCLAGTAHVFAVVGYDIATATYFTYSYSVMDEGTHYFLDYSDNSTFNDHETSVLPFEVPYFVDEYVNRAISKSEGLVIDPKTGIVDEYIGTSRFVCIPSYSTYFNGTSYEFVKVTGISENAFKNNTNIEVVYLNKFIDTIPDNAFENCTSLKEVLFSASKHIEFDENGDYKSGGIKIGNNAFSGCTSLCNFTVGTDVVSLGNRAFEGVNSIAVNAFNSSVADAAINSGASRISIIVKNTKDAYENKSIIIPDSVEYFALYGGSTSKVPKAYKGISIESDAGETVLNGIVFTDNKSRVLKTSSAKVSLETVSVADCNGIAMVFENENTEIGLFDTVEINTTGENAVLSKSLALTKTNASYTGKLSLAGNLLICGDVESGANYLIFSSGEKIIIDEDTFNMYLTSYKVTFDPNEGNLAEELSCKNVPNGTSYGELPVPTRDYYTFDGWYTESDGGDKIESTTIFDNISDITLYAHWTPNPLSEWTLVSEIPSDVLIDGRKWTYDLTTNITSSNPVEEGYTLYDTTSKWGEYGDWSTWSRAAVTASDSRQIETKTVTDQAGYTNYRYWVYRSSDGYSYGTYGYTPAGGKTCTIYDEINLKYSLPVYNSSLGIYGPFNSSMFSHSGDSYWFFGESKWVPAVTHTEYRYRDRALVYTYYHTKTETMESLETVTESDTISNVQEWVQYRVK